MLTIKAECIACTNTGPEYIAENRSEQNHSCLIRCRVDTSELMFFYMSQGYYNQSMQSFMIKPVIKSYQ